jgi:hypothetical protein
MAIVVRPAGYTGSLQRIVWAQGNAVPVTAYLWGGGGGGGGADAATNGGVGGGAGYTQVNFVVNEGDIIEVAVGGKGTGGQNSASNGAGGEAGASYISDFDFTTRTAATSPAVFPQFNSAYCTFLNNNGVWTNPTSAAVFDRSYTVNFPVTGNYQFTMAADNYARCFVDGVEVFYADNFQTPWTVGYPVTAGTRTIRILADNTGGPGAVALTIVNSIAGASFSGGRGGNSGPAGSSGAGAGGGGATVIILNNVPIAAAAGGGGGGGGGNSGARTGGSAPGPNGQAAAGDNAGQNGTNKPGDGGGGGGGGGGWGGGQGGTTPGGDQGGYAGSPGLSSGTVTADPSGPTPGGTSNQYWRNAGQGGTLNGGSGTTGYAVFEFDVSGIFVHVNGQFNPVNETYVKANGVWNQVKSAYIKQGGTWIPVNGSTTPAFENVANRFGVNPRGGVVETQAGGTVDNAGTGESGGADGGGGGGGCFLAGTQIIMIDGTLKSIEDIVAGDIILEALSNKPARVIGIKTRAHDINKWVFSLDKKVKPYITEEHPWYDDSNELCAISNLATTLAPWLGPIKIVNVANKKKITEAVTVYNLMLETGESHYANSVRVSNIVKTGGSYILVQKGFLDQATYENYVHNLENQNVSPAQQILIFNYMLKLTNYILQNNNICSKILGKLLAWALKNRDSVYPYLNRWFKSRLRQWIFRKNI